MPNWFRATGILYTNPIKVDEASPLIDELTLTVAGMLFEASQGENVMRRGGYDFEGHTFAPRAGFRGTHQCCCGAMSTAQDYHLGELPNGVQIVTNWLAVHYLACHRSSVSGEDMGLLHELIEATGAQPSDTFPRLQELLQAPSQG